MLLGAIVQAILATLLLSQADGISVLEVVCKRNPTLRFCSNLQNVDRNAVDDAIDSAPLRTVEFGTTVLVR